MVRNARNQKLIYSSGSASDYADDLSIAPAGEGKIHSSFRNELTGQLKFATRADGTWISQNQDAIANDVSNLVLDSMGNAHLSYVDGRDFFLVYATNSSGKWVHLIVDKGDHSQFTPSIAIDISGNIHIASYDAAGKSIKISNNLFGNWNTQTLGWTGSALSLASDSAASQHLSYIDNSELKYATNKSGTWKTYGVTRDAGLSADTSLFTVVVVDSLDKVHIGYYRGNNTSAYITSR